MASNYQGTRDVKKEHYQLGVLLTEEKKKEIQKAIKKYKPESILILGTSDEMVSKIAKNLGFEPISESFIIGLFA